MSDERLHALLIRAADEGRAESQLQAWPVVQEAFREHVRAGAPRQRPRALAALATAALLALVAALAFTAPGSAVADWVRDHIVGKPGARKSAPALTHLPGGGRLLVGSRAGVWVVQADGSRRLLRGYAGATWSPRGLFIAAWRRHELFALEPAGAVRWSLARGGRVRAADWSPDGFRVAYLAGRSLRVVAGDGSGDRLLRRKVQAVAPAWKPRAPHFLAFAPRAGVLDVVETDLRALAWRRSIAEPARSLAWSADGGLLAVAGRSGVTVLDGNTGRVRDRVAALPGFRVQAISFAPRGARLAVVLNSPSGRARATSVDLGRRGADPRLLFAGGGRFSQVSWSPDGRWILIAWPAADQWLFLRSSKVTGVSAVRGIARQFDPGIEGPAFPALGPWCCAPTLE